MARDRYIPNPVTIAAAQPFDSMDALWFWFMQAQQARIDGAKSLQGGGLVARPCEPIDVLRVLDRLHRNRSLSMDHMLVLRHYGLRMLPPDPRRAQEQRAHRLWTEAMAVMEQPFIDKGILSPRADMVRFWGGSVVVPMHVLQEAAE